MLHRDALATHATRQLLALEDASARTGDHRTRGTGLTMGFGAVTHGAASEVVTLDTAGIAFALGSTDNINELSSSKYINAEAVPDLVFRSIRESHFTDEFHRADARLREMTFLRLVYILFLHFTEAKLDGVIAIVFHRLVLEHDVVAGLDDRNGNDFAFLREDLGHTKFST